jgi:signal transduction histidine kinase
MAKILVVDDWPSNREVLSSLLGYFGHSVLEASDGGEALTITRARQPDLVITDLLMPHVDGYEFVRQLRNDPTIAATPVIFYTAAYRESDVRTLATASGVHWVLSKPSDPEVIMQAVSAALGAEALPLSLPAAQFEEEHRRLLTDTLLAKVTELAAANLRLSLLVKAGQSVASGTDARVTLQTVCEASREIFGVESALAGLTGPDGIPVHCTFAGGDEGRPRDVKVEALRDIVAELVQARGVVRLSDTGDKLHGSGASTSKSGLRRLMGIAVRSSDAVIAFLCVVDRKDGAEFSEQDAEVMTTLAAQYSAAFERIDADANLKASEQQYRDLAGRLQSIREEERTRIARELHDELGQALTAIRMNVSWMGRHAQDEENRVSERARTTTVLIDSTIDSVRRIAAELRPGVLDFGLTAAIEWQAQEFESQTGIPCELLLESGSLALDEQVSVAIFRILQETLTNVARHAEATSVVIRFRCENGEALLFVQDNGRGVNAEILAGKRSLGLVGMRERAKLLGGTLSVQGAAGRGTTVQACIPADGLASGNAQ